MTSFYKGSRHWVTILLPALSLAVLSSCTTVRKQVSAEAPTITSIKFLGEFDLPHKMQFKGTTVGGLSSIDYNPDKNEYYLISDDRSAINPARFYTADIRISEQGIDTVQLTDVTTLRQKNGQPYPNSGQDPAHTPDPEGLRYNRRERTMVWTSEGERIVRSGNTVLEDPAITVMRPNGRYVDTFALPQNMHMQATENGPRQNGVFEGLSFTDNFRTLYVNVEEPLYQDGPRAAIDTAGWIRIIKYDVRTRRPIAQFAYRIDPVFYKPFPASAFKINGVPDILALDDHHLLVTERSFSTGIPGCVIRLYVADLSAASDVAGKESLRDGGFQGAGKKLLFDFQTMHRYVDNVEGATFGPMLPNGHRSLLFVVDDNFSAIEKTQFFLFEVIP